MVKYQVTAAIESLVRELRSISEEIEPQLHLVSQDARTEWNALQNSWPSDDQLREGVTVLTEDQLKASEAKVRRFSDIIHGYELSNRRADAVTEGHADHVASGANLE